MASVTRTYNVQEAKTQLSRLLKAVEAGEEVQIARAGRVVARLVRVEPETPREWGCFEGEGRFEDDAFAPLSDDEADAWEEGSLNP